MFFIIPRDWIVCLLKQDIYLFVDVWHVNWINLGTVCMAKAYKKSWGVCHISIVSGKEVALVWRDLKRQRRRCPYGSPSFSAMPVNHTADWAGTGSSLTRRPECFSGEMSEVSLEWWRKVAGNWGLIVLNTEASTAQTDTLWDHAEIWAQKFKNLLGPLIFTLLSSLLDFLCSLVWKPFHFSVSFSQPLFSPQSQGSPFELLRAKTRPTTLPVSNPGVSPGSFCAHLASLRLTTAVRGCFPLENPLGLLQRPGSSRKLTLRGLWRSPWGKKDQKTALSCLTLPLSPVSRTPGHRNIMNPLKTCTLTCQPPRWSMARVIKCSYHLLSTYYELDLWVRSTFCTVSLNFTLERQGRVYYFHFVAKKNDPRGLSRNPALGKWEGA